MRSIIAVFLGCILSVAMSSSAHAQESGDLPPDTSAARPKRLELEAGAGYVVGMGALAAQQSYDGAPGSGMAVLAGLNYRLSRRWALGLQGEYYDFAGGPASPARGLAASAAAVWHFDGSQSADPWLRLGAGYRVLWEGDPSSVTGALVSMHGLELVQVSVGYDVTLSKSLTVAPVIGAALDAFLWEDAPADVKQTSYTRFASLIYLGVQGRLALGGADVARP
jgi:hypothetical protein